MNNHEINSDHQEISLNSMVLNGKLISIDQSAWFATAFSWICPGAGHFIHGKVWRGVFWIGFSFLLFIALFGVALSTRVSYAIGACLFFLTALLSRIFACIDTFICSPCSRESLSIRRGNKLTKDSFAVFLTTILPGLGHLYLRRWAFVGFMIICHYILYKSFAYNSLPYIFFSFVLLRIISMADIWRFYKKAPTCKPKAWLCLFLLIWVYASWIQVVRPWLIKKYVIEISECNGNSMAPTIHDGDMIVVNKLAYYFESPKSRDIVIISASNERLIKRIIACPGQTVSYYNGDIYLDDTVCDFVNSQPIERSIKEINESETSDVTSEISWNIGFWGILKPYKVGANSYFVLGDNLLESTDSRVFGQVDIDKIVGKVIKCRSHIVYKMNP